MTQTGSDGAFSDWTDADRDAYLGSESYRLVRSNLPVAAGSGEAGGETSLFDGLP